MLSTSMEAHHIFPQAKEFAAFFERAKINIHDPVNMRWWPTASHKKAAHAYNEDWAKFFDSKSQASNSEIMNQGAIMMKNYGF